MFLKQTGGKEDVFVCKMLNVEDNHQNEEQNATNKRQNFHHRYICNLNFQTCERAQNGCLSAII